MPTRGIWETAELKNGPNVFHTAPDLHSIWYKFRFRAAAGRPLTILRTAGIPRDTCAPRRMEEPWTGFHLAVGVRWVRRRGGTGVRRPPRE